jgi:hypothetical protein
MEREHLAVGQLERPRNEHLNIITLEDLHPTAKTRLILKLLGGLCLVLALPGLGPAAPTPLALLVLAAGSHRVISIGTQGRRTHNHPSSRSLALSISWL